MPCRLLLNVRGANSVMGGTLNSGSEFESDEEGTYRTLAMWIEVVPTKGDNIGRDGEDTNLPTRRAGVFIKTELKLRMSPSAP